MDLDYVNTLAKGLRVDLASGALKEVRSMTTHSPFVEIVKYAIKILKHQTAVLEKALEQYEYGKLHKD